MSGSYDLSSLDERSFEHMVNFLAMRTLGKGITVFGPGSDGGRDGYFKGKAPYPSDTDNWSGVWYIQSKFHRPHLSTDPQKWLQEQVKNELDAFSRARSKRIWPNNWIIATNIDISATPETGTFDTIRNLVSQYNKELSERIAIWGGDKIVGLLIDHPSVAEQYMHFVTPGHVLSNIYSMVTSKQADLSEIVRHFVVTMFDDQQYTKLEQAGASSDSRPGIQQLFVDLPYKCLTAPTNGMCADSLASACARNHRFNARAERDADWLSWTKLPKRARVWFIKAGPGQGKSTLGQYLSQIHRASFILGSDQIKINPRQYMLAEAVRDASTKLGLWTNLPRIPIYLELKEYAQWVSRRDIDQPIGILSFIAHLLHIKIQKSVEPGFLKNCLKGGKWLFVFDGLDEVPSDTKDKVALEVTSFIDGLLVDVDCDGFCICTSRPQGYSGQFSDLYAAGVELSFLNTAQALACAVPILNYDRTPSEAVSSIQILEEALKSYTITEIMKTPLQAHIMAIVIRDGGRPPERRWQLYDNFYRVIKKREANKASPNRGLDILLRDGDKLIKALHNRLGYELHRRAEIAEGSDTSIDRQDLQKIVSEVTGELLDSSIEETASILMEATTDRLVLVNTPENSDNVKFDVRQLQEFFAGEYLYEGTGHQELYHRLILIGADQHWREVTHFVFSAIIENRRQADLSAAVTVLNSIDTSPNSSEERIYNRRLCVGGSMAGRLLNEGVLEQDKRDRNQFRSALSVLLSVTEISLLYPLLFIRGKQSKAWLADLAADHLVENDYSEAVGAAVICLFVADDEFKRSKAVLEKLRNAPISFIVAVIGILPADRHDGKLSINSWGAEFLIEILLKDSARAFDQQTLSIAIGYLASSRSLARSFSNLSGLSENLVQKILPFFIDVTNDENAETPVEHEGVCGPINVSYCSVEQHKGMLDLNPEERSSLQHLTGIFSHIGPLIDVYGSCDLHELRHNVQLYIQNGPACIPRLWHDFLPSEFIFFPDNSDAAHNAFNSVEDRTFVRKTVENLAIGRELAVDKDGIIRFITRFPTLCLGYLFDDFGMATEESEKLNHDPAVLNAVCDALNSYPTIILSNVRYWGALQDYGLRNGVDFMAIIIRQAFADVVLDQIPSDVTDFKISLPADNHLLPHIANIIVQSMWIPDRAPFDLGQSSYKRRKSACEKIANFVPSCVDLLRICVDPCYPAVVRASSAILYLLHSESNKEHYTECFDTIVECYDNKYEWYLPAASSAMVDLIPGNKSAAITLGRLMDLGRNDFAGRISSSKVWDVLRERSTAPAHAQELRASNETIVQ